MTLLDPPNGGAGAAPAAPAAASRPRNPDAIREARRRLLAARQRMATYRYTNGQALLSEITAEIDRAAHDFYEAGGTRENMDVREPTEPTEPRFMRQGGGRRRHGRKSHKRSHKHRKSHRKSHRKAHRKSRRQQ